MRQTDRPVRAATTPKQAIKTQETLKRSSHISKAKAWLTTFCNELAEQSIIEGEYSEQQLSEMAPLFIPGARATWDRA